MKTSLFDYDLPADRIAQEPLGERDSSRLLMLQREGSRVSHHQFRELPRLLRRGDLLVVNDTRVVPARLFARRDPSGGRVEVLLLRERSEGSWLALLKPAAKARKGQHLRFEDSTATGQILEEGPDGMRVVGFTPPDCARELMKSRGRMPLPPYIHREEKPEELHQLDRDRYQTVFARRDGAIAAPTAGLHFTQRVFDDLMESGVAVGRLTLHVGAGTFRPIRTELLEHHELDSERFTVPVELIQKINETRSAGNRVIAVGTTCVRALESLGRDGLGDSHDLIGETGLYIHPGHDFEVVDGLLTNFHLPRSSLLVLVATMAGRRAVLAAYEEAIDLGYRFYSYGDCMLIL